jgi:hypothetical protein
MEEKVQQWVVSMINRACHYQGPEHAVSKRRGLKMFRLPSDPERPDMESPDKGSFVLNRAQMAFFRRASPVLKAWQSGEVAWGGVALADTVNGQSVRLNIMWSDCVFICDVPDPLREGFIELCRSRDMYLDVPDVDIVC